LKTGSQISCAELHVRTDSLELDSDGAIYAGDDRGRIVVIRNNAITYQSAHKAGIKKVVLDKLHRKLICLSYDGTMSVWQIRAEKVFLISQTQLPQSIWARSAAMMDDGRIAVATFGTSYAVYDPMTESWDLTHVQAGQAVNAVLRTKEHIYSIGDAGQLRCDGEVLSCVGSLCNFLVETPHFLLTGGQSGQLFNARSGEVLYAHHSPLNCAVVFKNDQIDLIAIGTYTGDIVVLQLEKEKVSLLRTIAVYENAIKALAVCQNQLFSVCANTDMAWHWLSDFSQARYIHNGHEKIINDCVMVDDTHFATVSRDRTLKIWNGKGHESYSSPHFNSVKCMGINASRSHILTGSYGGTVALFDLNKRQWAHLERPTMAGISDITWDAQDEVFLAASYDGHVYPVRGA
jgi:toxoflavin biosynthesis protein ToxC